MHYIVNQIHCFFTERVHCARSVTLSTIEKTIVGAVHHIAPIKIWYVQFAKILLYWMGIPCIVGQLGFRN